jgi:RTX calcium-binding nonapeptide repeat (4 copies)
VPSSRKTAAAAGGDARLAALVGCGRRLPRRRTRVRQPGTGPGDDDIAGGPGADTAFGGPGVDNMSGDPGNDTLWGNFGSDVISGGPGDDFIDGDNPFPPPPGPLPFPPGGNDDSCTGGPGKDQIANCETTNP